MQRRGDLYSDLTEVHVGDMQIRGQKAGEPEALALAKMIAKDNGDAVVAKLPSPLVAQPQDLHQFMIGKLPIDGLAQSQPYNVIRGGAYLTKLGRIFIVEFKGKIDEGRFGKTPILTPPHRTMNTTEPDVAGRAAMARMNAAGEAALAAKRQQQAAQKAQTEDLPQPGQTGQTYQVDPRVVGLTNHDEGSMTYITILSRSPKLYRMDFNADQRFMNMRDNAGFHFNENTPLGKGENVAFRPMTLQLYQQVSDRVNRLRQNPKPQPQQPTQPAQPAAPQPKPRRKLFGFL